MEEMEYDIIKYKKHLDKSKKYAKELEKNIVQMDQKFRDLQQKHKSQALASQMNDRATIEAGSPMMRSELNRTQSATKSIIEGAMSPYKVSDEGCRIQGANQSLIHLESNCIQDLGGEAGMPSTNDFGAYHFQNSYLEAVQNTEEHHVHRISQSSF
jgi:hypothetical protein